jgi:hypothetical protein
MHIAAKTLVEYEGRLMTSIEKARLVRGEDIPGRQGF